MREREASKKAAARNRHGREWVIFSAFQWKMGGRGDQSRGKGWDAGGPLGPDCAKSVTTGGANGSQSRH